MADNITLPGTGVVVATDDEGGFHLQKVKIAIRDDVLSTLALGEGEWIPLRVDANGALHVINAGASAIKADDAAFVPGTDSIAVIGGIAKEGRQTTISADNDAVRAAFDRYGRLKIVAGDELTILALQVTASGDTTLLAAGG